MNDLLTSSYLSVHVWFLSQYKYFKHIEYHDNSMLASSSKSPINNKLLLLKRKYPQKLLGNLKQHNNPKSTITSMKPMKQQNFAKSLTTKFVVWYLFSYNF